MKGSYIYFKGVEEKARAVHLSVELGIVKIDRRCMRHPDPTHESWNTINSSKQQRYCEAGPSQGEARPWNGKIRGFGTRMEVCQYSLCDLSQVT